MPVAAPSNLTRTLKDLMLISRASTSQVKRTGSLEDTPHARVYPDATTIAELRTRVKNELRPFDGGEPLLATAISDFKSAEWEKRIDGFLGQRPKLYDNTNKVWSDLPQHPSLERQLYEPLVNIIRNTLDHFGIAERAVFDTSRVFLSHENDGVEILDGSQLRPGEVEHIADADASKTVLKSAPDIIVVGRGGRCFENLEFPDPKEPSYASCAAIWEAKLTSSRETHEDHVVQLYVYARQTFAAQHNRDFLYAVLINESHVQLFQFNRSMVVYSSTFDHHKNHKDFVRLILAMASTDGSDLGFDPNIWWETVGDKRVRMMKLPLAEPNDAKKTSVAVEVVGIRWPSKEIRGRGTTCFSVEYDGVRRLVKKLWRNTSRTPEYKFLKRVKKFELKGVVSMFSYRQSKTSALKHKTLLKVVFGKTEMGMDRIWCCLTLVEYGPTLELFKSVLQLLYAFYDAVNGHWALWKIGILHRDVSINNVLFGLRFYELGNPYVDVGNRGVLIDLDLAISIYRTESNRNDILTGTRVFQSRKILEGGGWPHDFRDDLESYFNLLAWLALSYKSPGALQNSASAVLAGWCGEDPATCAALKVKHMHYFEKFILRGVSKELGQPILDLLKNIHGQIVDLPPEYLDPCSPDKKCVAELHNEADVDKFYTQYLGFIEQAIKEQILLDAQNAAIRPMANPQPDPDSPTRPPKTKKSVFWGKKSASKNSAPKNPASTIPIPLPAPNTSIPLPPAPTATWKPSENDPDVDDETDDEAEIEAESDEDEQEEAMKPKSKVVCAPLSSAGSSGMKRKKPDEAEEERVQDDEDEEEGDAVKPAPKTPIKRPRRSSSTVRRRGSSGNLVHQLSSPDPLDTIPHRSAVLTRKVKALVRRKQQSA